LPFPESDRFLGQAIESYRFERCFDFGSDEAWFSVAGNRVADPIKLLVECCKRVVNPTHGLAQ
jgi:hypothetical protein